MKNSFAEAILSFIPMKTMTKASVTESIIEMVEPVLKDEALDLVDVEYKKLGKTWTLRVFIDKAQGVTVEDCQKISRQIEDMIEVDDLIANPFVLEVSSPGLDRPLKKEQDFLRFKNKAIEVKTFSPMENRKNFQGVIRDCKTKSFFWMKRAGRSKLPWTKFPKPNPSLNSKQEP